VNNKNYPFIGSDNFWANSNEPDRHLRRDCRRKRGQTKTRLQVEVDGSGRRLHLARRIWAVDAELDPGHRRPDRRPDQEQTRSPEVVDDQEPVAVCSIADDKKQKGIGRYEKSRSILISVKCCKLQLFFVKFYWNFFHCRTTQVIGEIKFHFVLFLFGYPTVICIHYLVCRVFSLFRRIKSRF